MDDTPYFRRESDDTAEQQSRKTNELIIDEDDAKEYDYDELGMMIGSVLLLYIVVH